MTPRDHAIAAGVIRPGPLVQQGDPTRQSWRDEPTLRMDRTGVREARSDRERPPRLSDLLGCE